MARPLFIYADDIDTDRIIPGKYTKTTDLKEMAQHVFEDLDPSFRARVSEGAIVVAGHNFGCGSSREQAPLSIKHSGVALVIARSFARIFFRNAINIGLPLLEIPEHAIQTDSDLEYDLSQGWLRDRRYGREYQVAPLPPLLASIMQHGGLAPYLRTYGSYQAGSDQPLS